MASILDVVQPHKDAPDPQLKWVQFECEFARLVMGHKPKSVDTGRRVTDKNGRSHSIHEWPEGRPSAALAALFGNYILTRIRYEKSTDWTASFTSKGCEFETALTYPEQLSARRFLRTIATALGKPLYSDDTVRDSGGGYIRFQIDPDALRILLGHDPPPLQLDLFGDRAAPGAPVRTANPTWSLPKHSGTVQVGRPDEGHTDPRRSLIDELRELKVAPKRAREIVAKYADDLGHVRHRIDLYKTLPQWTDTANYFRAHGGSLVTQLIGCILADDDWTIPDSVVAKKNEENQAAASRAAAGDAIRKEEEDHAAETRRLMTWLAQQTAERQDKICDNALKSLPDSTQRAYARGASHGLGFYQAALERKIAQAMAADGDRAPP